MSKGTILERAVFHICNSGLILSIEHDPPEGESSNLVYSIPHLKAKMQAFGIPISMKIPLGSPEIVWWLHHVTGKILGDMITKRGQGRYFVFKSPGRMTIENGEECDLLFRAPTRSVPVKIWKEEVCKLDRDEGIEDIKISLLAFGDEYRRKFVDAITEEELRHARADVLGKNGSLNRILDNVSEVPSHRKREAGEMINSARGECEIAFETRLREIHGLCK